MNRNLILTVLLAVFIYAGAFGPYYLEFRRAEAERAAEEQRIGQIEQEMAAREQLREQRLEAVEKEREEKAADLYDFHSSYSRARNTFEERVKNLSGNPRAENIGQIIELTEERLQANLDFKKELEGMEFPQALENFYDAKMDFLDNDHQVWSATKDYYTGSSSYNTSELEHLHTLNLGLFARAEEELARVYSSYGLQDLLKDF